jgi:hypothetical protein
MPVCDTSIAVAAAAGLRVGRVGLVRVSKYKSTVGL